MTLRIPTIAAVTGLVFMAACAQQEEPVVVSEEPIFSKDGRIIAYRPTVTPGDTGISPSTGAEPDEGDRFGNSPGFADGNVGGSAAGSAGSAGGTGDDSDG